MEITKSIQEQWQNAATLFAKSFPVDLVMVMKVGRDIFQVLATASENPVADLTSGNSLCQETTAHPCFQSVYGETPQEWVWPSDPANAVPDDGFPSEFSEYHFMIGLPLLDSDQGLFGILCLFQRDPNPVSELFSANARQLRNYIELGLALLREKEYLQVAYETIRKSVEEINVLRKILPICAHCKKVRNDNGYWQQVENYFHQNAQLDFTHSICPDCMHELYPDIADRVLKNAEGQN